MNCFIYCVKCSSFHDKHYVDFCQNIVYGLSIPVTAYKTAYKSLYCVKEIKGYSMFKWLQLVINPSKGTQNQICKIRLHCPLLSISSNLKLCFYCLFWGPFLSYSISFQSYGIVTIACEGCVFLRILGIHCIEQWRS